MARRRSVALISFTPEPPVRWRFRGRLSIELYGPRRNSDRTPTQHWHNVGPHRGQPPAPPPASSVPPDGEPPPIVDIPDRRNLLLQYEVLPRNCRVTLPIDDENAPLYSVGQAAEMLERAAGLPAAAGRVRRRATGAFPGGQRRYSRRQIHLVQRINGLAGEGIGLAGVRRVLALEEKVASLTSERDAAIEDARLARLGQRAGKGRVSERHQGTTQRTR